jgi:hypothetical protein
MRAKRDAVRGGGRGRTEESLRLSAPHRAESLLQLLHLGGVDCRQRLLLPDTIPRGLGLGVLCLARLLLHISEELAQLQRAQPSGLRLGILKLLPLLGVEVDAQRGRGLVQVELPGLLSEYLEKGKDSAPLQAFRRLELAVYRQRADPLSMPRCSIPQGLCGGERRTPALFIPQEPELL